MENVFCRKCKHIKYNATGEDRRYISGGEIEGVRIYCGHLKNGTKFVKKENYNYLSTKPPTYTCKLKELPTCKNQHNDCEDYCKDNWIRSWWKHRKWVNSRGPYS